MGGELLGVAAARESEDSLYRSVVLKAGGWLSILIGL